MTLQSLASAPELFEPVYLLKFYEKSQQNLNSPKVIERTNSDPIVSFIDLLQYGNRAENHQDFADTNYLRAYSEYDRLKGVLLFQYQTILKSQNLLTKISMSPMSVLRAQFLHDGWAHLICNMLFFIVFAIFVENRLGGGLTLLIYFVGGSVGMFLQTKFLQEPTLQVFGASGSVCAILGASLALFWRRRVKVWMSLIFYNRVVLVPVLVALPFVAWTLDSIDAINSKSQIGHIAHIGGFCSGFALAVVFSFMDYIPKQFVFPEEYRLFKVFKNSTEFRMKLQALQKMLQIHPENSYVLTQSAEWFLKELVLHPAFFKNHILFISETLGLYIRSRLKKDSPKQIATFISCLPLVVNHRLIFKYVPIPIQLEVQDIWLAKNKFAVVISENLEIESKLDEENTQTQWTKILESLEAGSSKMGEQEFNEISHICENQSRKKPDHFFLKKLILKLENLKEKASRAS